MADRTSILRRLSHASGQMAADAKAWFAEEDTEILANEGSSTTVYEATHLWRVRLANSKKRGQNLVGAEDLLSKLEEMTQRRKLEQFAFANSRCTGSVFFEHAAGRFVGAVMVERHTNSQLKPMHPSSEQLSQAAS